MAHDHPRLSGTAWVGSIEEIAREEWDALAGPLETPILEWEWLRLMEASGSVCPRTGWTPSHLTIRSGGQLVAAAPLYIKTHSAGEFVFDYIWADVASRLGIRYYPKLVGMSPATPTVGYRFLIAPGQDEEALTGRMLAEIERLCREQRLGGASFLFADPAWAEGLTRHGYLSWRHQSFAWRNEGFSTFEDYLAVFDKNQRRNIRRERQAMEDQGIRIETLAGEDVPDSWFPLMYRFYDRTNTQFGPWAARYLTREFFLLLPRYRRRLLFVAAHRRDGGREDEERPLAMSLLLCKGPLLLGRYWGSFEALDSLHFNACYYRPIEWAIEHGVQLFDPGAGSTHKIRRGFRAVANVSLHRFSDPRLQQLMAAHLGEINRMEEQEIEELNAGLPFAQGRAPGRGSKAGGPETAPR